MKLTTATNENTDSCREIDCNELDCIIELDKSAFDKQLTGGCKVADLAEKAITAEEMG